MMNLKKDLTDELERQLYLRKSDFYSVVWNENIVYSEKLEKLIGLAKEITLLASTMNTVDSLLKSQEKTDGNIS